MSAPLAVSLGIAGYLLVAFLLAVAVARVTKNELSTAWMIAWPLTLPVVLVGALAQWLCDQ